jgi:hypothetical protein
MGNSFYTYICDPGSTTPHPVTVTCPGSCVCNADGKGCNNNLECATGDPGGENTTPAPDDTPWDPDTPILR